MLLQERMQSTKFSRAEEIIVSKILELQEQLDDYSTTRLAKETFSTPAAIVRLTKKLGFHGWNDFKRAFLREVHYLKGAFQEVDANYPFNENSSDNEILHNLGSVYTESVKDTLSLIDLNDMKKAVEMIDKASRIVMFAVGNVNFVIQEFIFLMERIGKYIYCNTTNEMFFHIAQQMKPDELAIVVSYSGETPYLLRAVNHLEKNGVPIIAVTSIGGNTLSSKADLTLPLSTREKVYSKIGGFASITSIRFVLDMLYSCFYAKNFKENTEYKVNVARQIETGRQVHNEIVSEFSLRDEMKPCS